MVLRRHPEHVIARGRVLDVVAEAHVPVDGEKAMLESLIAFKRAGACGVLTYFAPRVAEALKDVA